MKHVDAPNKQVWISRDELNQMFSSAYWNDAEAEKQKIWGSWQADFSGLENRFLSKGLYQQFESLLKDNELPTAGANILSLGSGICILEAMVARNHPEVEKIYNVDLSEHRIFDIAPNIFDQYEIDPSRYELCLGSFINLQVEDESIDIVLLSQAFHHCSEPEELLTEIKRVLRPGGAVLIIGEHFFSRYDILKRFVKHFLKYAINYKSIRSRAFFFPTWRCLFPIDQKKGDHHYTKRQYFRMFEALGFSATRNVFLEYKNQSFFLRAG